MACLALIGTFVIVFLHSVLSGLVLCVMWRWFVVPVFDVPELSIPLALGLTFIVHFLTYFPNQGKSEDEDATETIIKLFVYSIGRPLVYLVLGWIVTLFM